MWILLLFSEEEKLSISISEVSSSMRQMNMRRSKWILALWRASTGT